MLKVWNASLVLATGTLAVIGTFLVRSGILSSIHAFVSDPTLNISFVVLISVMVIGSIALVTWRRDRLRTDARLDSLISREAVFLFQNLVLVALTAVIFWITFFPLISEAITGTQVSVGPPAFRPFVVPLALIVVVLSGIGPIIAWRRVTVAKLRRSFAFPGAATALALVVLLTVPGVIDHRLALIMFCAGTFVVSSVVQEFGRGVRARRAMTSESPPAALAALVRRNRRRYGGYIVHAGVAVALVGVAASTSFQHSRTATISPGQSVHVNGYTIRYVRPTASATAEKISLGAILDVTSGRQHVATLRTSYGLYPSQDPTQPIGRFFNGSNESRVGLKSGPLQDIWTVINPNVGPLQGLINQGDTRFSKFLNDAMSMPAAQRNQALSELYSLRDTAIRGLAQRFVNHPWAATFLIIVSPMVTWLWAGAIIAALGGLLALWPLPPRRRRRPGRPSPADDGGLAAPPPERVPARELVTRLATADGDGR
ncbi:MAG: cytochrome c-type biosis protein CcmF [Solirubrobacteraceae bacterium]|nr:cytochrome c-type biosis protein CcmF [Solirubrobacteraceae bacterium]